MSDLSEFRRHLKFQSGCYLDLSEIQGEVAYARSSRVSDTGWNYIYSESPDASLHASREDARGIKSIFYSSLQERDLFLMAYSSADVHQETWLARNEPIATITPTTPLFSRLHVCDQPAPTSDFLTVFEGVLDDLGMETADLQSFRSQYGSSLRAARATAGVSVSHLVGYVDDAPVACASIYFDGELACLYNVGAAKGSKRHGFGSHVSELAVNTAFGAGVRRVFLQCATGGYVESMYRRLGFSEITDGTGFVDFA